MLKKFKNKKKRQSKRSIACKLITHLDSNTIVSEQFRTLRTNINFSMPDQELKTILFTSATPGEGKSTISANTATVFAQQGKKVLLIDADMRKPTTHYTFNCQNTKGLSTLLSRQYEVNNVIQKTSIRNLDLITSGPIPPNPAELLGSKLMDQLIEQLSSQYDMLLFDAPPVLSVTDAQILSHKCQGTILVLNARKTEKESVLKAKSSLHSSQANIIGTVLNNFVVQNTYHYYR
ncbi:CpsD/CapB family tyrosine-protein kinase [Sporosarcina ureae]|uniref:CpsD/CapB family tyrosine-protein kinase n=1 Tax=Sporosarcina ureae TaxID=1571 RepID=UPI0026EA52D3|nr:CpsD/CapB family tyrosine-protein kinase [Sporosarcina ureae]